MIFDPSRHEPLQALPWDEGAARAAIDEIVAGAHAGFVAGEGWPVHPMDHAKPAPWSGLYIGDGGVIWALRYLEAPGAIEPGPDYGAHLATLEGFESDPGSYLFGDLSLLMLRHARAPETTLADRIAELVAQTLHHPARELMWGAPGGMLAAWFMHQRTQEPRWAGSFRRAAQVLRGELLWSGTHACHHWQQDLYGRQSTYLDAVHGFVATASVLQQGRELLAPEEWAWWQSCIATTVRATAEWQDGMANWRSQLHSPPEATRLVQFCHGAPGFVICLGDSPDAGLDDLLLAGGQMTWHAGPLAKGANLCHGTGGNGYAFLKLHRRTGDTLWLERARAFAMHGIAQVRRDLARHGQWRHGLWTGDLGFAIYLFDCIERQDRFPTLEVF